MEKEDNGRLLVVIPAYNEEASIGGVLCELRRKCPQADVLVVNDGSADGTLRVCREAGFTPNIVASYPNVETVVMMVQAGAGVALLSPFAPLEGLSGVVCVPLTASPAVSLDLLWRKDNANPAMPLLVEQAKGFDW